MKRQAQILRQRADSLDVMAEREQQHPEVLAAAAEKQREQQSRQARLWARTSTEKEEYKF